MNRASVVILILSLAAPLAAQAPVERPGPAQEFLKDIYIAQFTSQVQPTDEQLPNLVPLIQVFIRERFMAAQRRQRIMEALKNASDADTPNLTTQLDEVDRRAQNIERNFLTRIDPILTPQQRRNLRLFQDGFARRLGPMIEEARQKVLQLQQEREAEQARRKRQQEERLKGSSPQRPAVDTLR